MEAEKRDPGNEVEVFRGLIMYAGCIYNILGKLNVRFRDITPRLVSILPSICFSDGGELAIVIQSQKLN